MRQRGREAWRMTFQVLMARNSRDSRLLAPVDSCSEEPKVPAGIFLHFPCHTPSSGGSGSLKGGPDLGRVWGGRLSWALLAGPGTPQPTSCRGARPLLRLPDACAPYLPDL